MSWEDVALVVVLVFCAGGALLGLLLVSGVIG